MYLGEHLEPGLLIALKGAPKLAAFELCVVGYDTPESPRHGLERKDATALLRTFDLQQPTMFQTLQVGGQVGKTDCLWGALGEHSDREVVALTSFHPEVPAYFSIGRTILRTPAKLYTTFFRPVHSIGSSGRLGFWSEEDNDGSSAYELRKKKFPWIIGITAG